MNSTENSKKAEQFFNKWLRPLLSNPKVAQGYFPKGFDKNTPSYFITRKETRMTAKDFELGSKIVCSGAELSHLEKPMAKLAQSLYSIEDQNEEVSPFIYVMY